MGRVAFETEEAALQRLDQRAIDVRVNTAKKLVTAALKANPKLYLDLREFLQVKGHLKGVYAKGSAFTRRPLKIENTNNFQTNVGIQ